MGVRASLVVDDGLQDAREAGEDDIEAILAEILAKEEQKAVVSRARHGDASGKI